MQAPDKGPEMTAADVAGCIGGLVMLLITTPIWYVLLFVLLSRTEAPGWAWALYWLYVPTHVLVAFCGQIWRVLTRS